MNFPLYIARRYLFSKKSHHAINIISAISACGVAIATVALVCTLSVFNGFQQLVAGLFTSFDPELKIIPTKGSTFPLAHPIVKQLEEMQDIETLTPCLEGQALIVREGRQVVVTIKGMADNWASQVDAAKIFYPQGQRDYLLHADVLEYGVLGIQLASKLGLSANFPDPVPIYAPKKGERVNMANPMSSFNKDELLSPGYVFMVKQAQYDANYVITSLGFAQRLLDHYGDISQIELKLKSGVNTGRAKRKIKDIVGTAFTVQDRYEQQEDVFRIMRVEKLIAYLFLTFILLVASFNIVGSLSMLMIDKKKDVETLRNLGANESQICKVFMLEGRLISLCGSVVGIIIGVVLCWLQQEYGLISMGQTEGTFIIESYPVSVRLADILLIFVTVVAVSWVVVWYPVHRLSRRLLI
ncbi:MAG: FtsX-like permease family protein [Prevotellaceae bacterium]|nr:FtsX-like permease family protein [Prevotellaceae bacterium]